MIARGVARASGIDDRRRGRVVRGEAALMTPRSLDQRLRHHIYSALAQGGRAPAASSLAVTFGVDEAEVRDALKRLHAAHDLVLDAETRDVRMALPFSNVPTAY